MPNEKSVLTFYIQVFFYRWLKLKLKTCFCRFSNANEERQLPSTAYVRHTMFLTPDEAFRGATRFLEVTSRIVCDVCQGSGAANGIVIHYDACQSCNRTGEQLVSGIQRSCEICWGSGDTVSPADRCMKCHGTKTMMSVATLRVDVRPQTRNGKKIIFRGEGNQDPNKRRGHIAVFMTVLNDNDISA